MSNRRGFKNDGQSKRLYNIFFSIKIPRTVATNEWWSFGGDRKIEDNLNYHCTCIVEHPSMKINLIISVSRHFKWDDESALITSCLAEELLPYFALKFKQNLLGWRLSQQQVETFSRNTKYIYGWKTTKASFESSRSFDQHHEPFYATINRVINGEAHQFITACALKSINIDYKWSFNCPWKEASKTFKSKIAGISTIAETFLVFASPLLFWGFQWNVFLHCGLNLTQS